MAKSENQKQKILVLLDLFKSKTDEEHGVTTSDIIDYLAEHGIKAERKTVYADLNTLKEYGYKIAKEKKENFYHGILLGLLGYKSSWLIKSNAESGIGYSDILIETEDQETGIIIEIKYAETGNLEAVSEEALKQIEDRRYEEQLLEEGVEHILKYGIAFYKKKCRVMTVK